MQPAAQNVFLSQGKVSLAAAFGEEAAGSHSCIFVLPVCVFVVVMFVGRAFLRVGQLIKMAIAMLCLRSMLAIPLDRYPYPLSARTLPECDVCFCRAVHQVALKVLLGT